MSESNVPAVGSRLGNRYELSSVLGRGGFGTVFAATDTELGREVAIKVLNEPSPEYVERFLREARIVASMESEHVVRLFETGVDPSGAPFIVMERLRGISLAEHQLRASPSIQEAVDFVLEACVGVAEAHARGVVHRDLKPQNLFLADRRDGSRVLKVLDFGIAKSSQTSTLTTNHVAMGTLRYMPPEQIRDAKSADARSDVWALGVVLYEMLGGRPIFDCDSDAAFGALVLVADAVSVTDRCAEVPVELASIVHRCIARDRTRRFASIAELGIALAPFAGEAGQRAAQSLRASATQSTSSNLSSDLASVELAPTALDADSLEAAIAETRHLATRTPRRDSRGSKLAMIAIAAMGALGIGYAVTTTPGGGSKDASTASAEAAVTRTAAVPIETASAVPSNALALSASTSNALASSVSAVPTTVGTTSPSIAPSARVAATATARSVAAARELEKQQDAKFFEACLSVPMLVPAFLVAATDTYGQCALLRGAGCSKIQSSCTHATTKEALQRCNGFVATVRANGGCR